MPQAPQFHATFTLFSLEYLLEGEGGEAGGGDRHLEGGQRLRRGLNQHQVQVKQAPDNRQQTTDIKYRSNTIK